MRTISFKKVLEGALRRIGLDPTTVPTSTKVAWAGYLTERCREAWEWFDWPEMKVLEERVYADRYEDLDSDDILVGDVVYYNGYYWEALTTGPATEPYDGAPDWEITNRIDRIIPIDQTFYRTIDEVFNVFSRNPLTFNCSCPAYYSYYSVFGWPPSFVSLKLLYFLDERGIILPANAPNSVWIEYNPMPSEFAYVPWDSGTTYQVGDIVYLDSTGDCYKARQPSTNITPTTVDQTAFWQKQVVPRVLSRFMERACSGDGLLEDGQTDAGDNAISKAWDALVQEKDNVTLRQDQQRYSGFSVEVR
jgi:hypothetical protein